MRNENIPEIAKNRPAVGGPVERPVGRPGPERAAFEAWWSERHHPARLALDDNGQHLDWAAGLAWDAWQAARATPHGKTRSQLLSDAGFVRRPTLWSSQAREALELIAAPIRPDGTWNRDRESCRKLAAEALGRYEDDETPNVGGNRP